MEETKARVRQYLNNSFAGANFGDDDDFFALGLADEHFASHIIQFVESHFGITVEQHEMDMAHFNSVNAITDFIVSKGEG